MTSTRQRIAVGDARRLFDAGMAALGHLVCDDPPDQDRALAAFTRASEIDPTMGDAWLGRLAAGDRSGSTLFGLHRAHDSIGVQQRRVGLPRGALAGLAPVGLFVDYPITTADRAAAAYASSLIDGGDLDGARRILDSTADEPVVGYCRGVLHLRAGEWRAALGALAARDAWADPVLTAAAEYVAGTACIQLGMFDEGVRLLSATRDSGLDNARAAATFAIGMAQRTRGDEAAARACFQEAYALDPRLSDARRALDDPSYRLVIDVPDEESAPAAVDRHADLAAADTELASQVGLAAVKEQVERLRSSVLLADLRASKGLRTAPRSLHLTFTGPPGTGKTTVARIVARMYRGLGILATDTVVEVSRGDLVGEHLGSTAPKTSAVIDSALDGVLFIDEAYTLIQEGLSGGDAFGREALDTLLARMENDRDRLVVVIAGYDDEIDRLLAANEGLASRFARRIRFDSYSPSELVRIAESMAGGRDSRLAADACQVLEASFERLCTTSIGTRRAIDVAGNGRHVRNLIEAAEEEREHRLATSDDIDALSEADLMTLTAADVRAALSRRAD
ncbi:type VII secretion AAA-ATPase EccA [Gordonia sp. HY285]|uniref:type VII secretion AAA-ATPase EccA n=1 Tax=Gordonia liuliyuniae TaxID=2911517 RepID=UPI001F00F88A|nr:type VII secretion AAA-ATPase EccA [Gordonia liuliyuniae]MCF8609641.1 type VII secretion AAA-ATPase EccA [Gordonia liuliyuniae]